MSLATLDWAFAREVLSASRKSVLIALAYHANETTLNAYPSIETLCRETELDRKTVIASLDQLVADDWVLETGKRVGKTGRVKVYHFHRVEIVPQMEPLNRAIVPKPEPLKGEIVAQSSANNAGNSPVNGGAIVPKTELRTGNREPGTRTGRGEDPQVRKELSGAERVTFDNELKRIDERLRQIEDCARRDVFNTATYDDEEREERKKLKARREELKEKLGCVI